MRSALTGKICCIRQNHYLATTTNMVVAVYEQDEAGAAPEPKLERANEQLLGMEDIPGTCAFDIEHSVKAINLNRFFWRHREAAFRMLVTRDMEAAFNESHLTEEEKELVRRKD